MVTHHPLSIILIYDDDEKDRLLGLYTFHRSMEVYFCFLLPEIKWQWHLLNQESHRIKLHTLQSKVSIEDHRLRLGQNSLIYNSPSLIASMWSIRKHKTPGG